MLALFFLLLHQHVTVNVRKLIFFMSTNACIGENKEDSDRYSASFMQAQ